MLISIKLLIYLQIKLQSDKTKNSRFMLTTTEMGFSNNEAELNKKQIALGLKSIWHIVSKYPLLKSITCHKPDAFVIINYSIQPGLGQKLRSGRHQMGDSLREKKCYNKKR